MAKFDRIGEQRIDEQRICESERYLNHPTFGMLYRVAAVSEGRDLFATLYAQRIFSSSPCSPVAPPLRWCR